MDGRRSISQAFPASDIGVVHVHAKHGNDGPYVFLEGEASQIYATENSASKSW